MAIQLFIDTNVYLGFYQHSKDDVRDLDDLLFHLHEDRVVLHLPQQVHEEWERNREARLSAAGKEFQKNFFSSEIPRHMQGLAMAKSYVDATAEAKKARDHLIAEAIAKARSFELDVDKRLELIFSAASYHDHDLDVLGKGRLRAEIGNPPGKPGGIGDQYNWEMLLAKLPDEDLYIVTKDGDFASTLDGKDERGMPYPDPFLKREWSQQRGKSNLYIFDNIKAFIKHYEKTLVHLAVEQKPEKLTDQNDDPPKDEHKGRQNHQENVGEYVQPELKKLTADEQTEKIAAIVSLESSGAFATTHAAIRRLQHFKESFLPDEVKRLFRAAIDNNQVGLIISDNDVSEFYMFLFSRYVSQVDPDLMDEAIDLLGLTPDAEDQDPFADGWELL